jgi:hypothetical protein
MSTIATALLPLIVNSVFKNSQLLKNEKEAALFAFLGQNPSIGIKES